MDNPDTPPSHNMYYYIIQRETIIQKIPSESTIFNNNMIADLLEIKNTMQ
jgi:hypothetical protein